MNFEQNGHNIWEGRGHHFKSMTEEYGLRTLSSENKKSVKHFCSIDIFNLYRTVNDKTIQVKKINKLQSKGLRI